MKTVTLNVIGMLCLLLGASAQQGSRNLSLRECIETAMTNNMDVQQRLSQMQSDKVNWNAVKLNLLPDLNGSASAGVNTGRSIDPFTNAFSNQQITFSSYGLSSGVTLFNGGALRNTTRQAKFAYEASKMELQQEKENLSINVILAYLQVLSNQELVGQSENQLNLSRKQVERLEILNRDGAITPYLLYDLKGQLAGDQLAIVNARNALQTARINLFRLMNVMYDPLASFAPLDSAAFAEERVQEPEAIYTQSLETLSIVKAAELRRRSLYLGLKAAKGRYFPVLSLFGSASTNYSSGARSDVFVNTVQVVTDDYALVNGTPAQIIRKQDNYRSERIPYRNQLNNNLFTSFNLNLAIPLFNGSFTRRQVKQARIELNNSEKLAATARTSLQQSVYEAHMNMQTAMDKYKTLLDQAKAYAESFRSAEIRFNEGVINSVDYLTAKNNLDKANVNLIAARYDVVLRRKILDFYEGRPLW